ncbi:MAG: division/cell wall cluster transcriptional repressor MraZ, partial [Patescibacteria group bacterium]
MFIGEYKHTIDEKGRMALPAKFRLKMKGAAIITRGLDHCLFVFTAADWEILAKKLMSLPLVQSNSRAFARLMLAGAMEADIDKQGRILISDYLREYAGLKKQAVVAGLYNRIEVWDTNKWDAYKRKTEKDS